ncbi:ankyrin repeat-containing domain protein [Aspergillus insuetus]
MVFSTNSSVPDPRVEEKLDLLASMVLGMWSTLQASSAIPVYTPDSRPAINERRSMEVRHILEGRGVSSDVFNHYEDRVLLRVDQLLTNRSEADNEPYQETPTGNVADIRSALLEATAQSNWDEVQKLLDDNIDLNIHTAEARLAFSLALTQGEWSVVQTLVKLGIDPNGKSADRQPAICVAASAKAWDIVELLMKSRADLNARDNTLHSALLRAASHRRWDMVFYLAWAGAKVRPLAPLCLPDSDSGTVVAHVSVLTYAAEHGDWEHFEELLERGAHPDSKSLKGNPIIIFAAHSRRWDMVRLLVRYKANVTLRDRVGRRVLAYMLTALLAQWQRPTVEERLEIAEATALLLSAGAEVGEEELKAVSLSPLPLETWQAALTPQTTADDLVALVNALSLLQSSGS